MLFSYVCDVHRTLTIHTHCQHLRLPPYQPGIIQYTFRVRNMYIIRLGCNSFFGVVVVNEYISQEEL